MFCSRIFLFLIFQGKRCLQLVPSLASSHLKHEDNSLATELLRLLLHIENRIESDEEFPGLKRKAVEAVVVSKPLPALSHLVPALFSKDNTLNTKFLIMDCLVGAGARLAEANDGVLGRFIALSVAGLSFFGAEEVDPFDNKHNIIADRSLCWGRWCMGWPQS